jgi:hypothetical protein
MPVDIMAARAIKLDNSEFITIKAQNPRAHIVTIILEMLLSFCDM